ncbi:MAG: DUF1801 domain-containing protein [Hyphomonas sp.]|uniref:DUF1801 domain-containing protein n=1 Tax=Hyphomonas sp. TaxID=87 RepID=UPI00349FFDA1
MQTDARADASIAKPAEFARPVLARLRDQAHAICPEAEEAIKWGMPARVCRAKILCGLAGSRGRVRLFVEGENTGQLTEGMGVFGKMRCMAVLPAKAALTKILKACMKASEAGLSGKPKAPKPPPGVPADLAKSPETSKPAAATRDRRIERAAEWLAGGEPRNWKYMKNQRLAPPGPVNPGVLVKALL